MNTLELFLGHKSKGHFTLEDIHILNDQLMGFYYVDKENPTKEEEMEEFKKYITNFKEINEIFDNVKESLLFTLNEYTEQDTKEEKDGLIYYAQSNAEHEAHSNEDVHELIKKLEELSNDEVIQLLTALMKARDFFDIFIVSDPLRELRRYKKRAEVFEKGYEVYKEGYESIEKTYKDGINNVADQLIKSTKERIELIKSAYIDSILENNGIKN